MDPLAGLIGDAGRREDVDLIYVNDNYGDFTADHSGIVAAALDGSALTWCVRSCPATTAAC